MQNKKLRIIFILVLTISAIVLLVTASTSLRWSYEHDSPLMIYAGFLMAGGAVPYLDFFDMNMPGTYFVMEVMGRIFGWDDFGFRVFDLLLLASISVSTFLFMRRFGNFSALAASIAFPLWYLNGGPFMSMQREYIALVPFTVMLAVATANTGFKPWLRTIVVGFLAGMTFLIKPQFLPLSLPLLIILFQRCTLRIAVLRIATFVGGMSIPLVATFLYLLHTGGLEPFIDMAANYWPLYTHITEQFSTISGFPRLLYIIKSTVFELLKKSYFVTTAVIGLIVLANNQTQKHYTWTVSGLLIAAALYPAVAGQFWYYHWIPFVYMSLCVASLSACDVPIKGSNIGGMVPVVALIILLFSLSSISTNYLLHTSWKNNGVKNLPKDGVPDEIFRFLRSHMNSGDTVQPLDWTGGAIHGMLMARAPLATRFIYDFHFYHNISSPYISKLRQEFINELVAKKPKFIIQVFGKNKPWLHGTDTTRGFPELKVFLEQYYALAQQATTYRILQRKE